MTYPFNYLIEFQYLGFRFHGWAKQPGVKTVHLMVDKTIAYVLGHDHFKTLGTSRTDARVSALHSAFQLFLKEDVQKETFLRDFNNNLPQDIRALDMVEVPSTFNIIQSPRTKEYRYYFCHGIKAHPFCAPFLTCINDTLDIHVMKRAALLFSGSHDFRQFTTKPSENADCVREINKIEILPATDFNASFFPEEIFMLRIVGSGFLRHQIRLIMGQLIMVGKGDIGIEAIKSSLDNPVAGRLDYIAPASGLILWKINFKKG